MNYDLIAAWVIGGFLFFLFAALGLSHLIAAWREINATPGEGRQTEKQAPSCAPQPELIAEIEAYLAKVRRRA